MNRYFTWWQRALFGEQADAVDMQLAHGAPSIGKRFRKRLVQAVVGRSFVASYDNDFFLKNVVRESYQDILDIPELTNYVRGAAASVGHPADQPIKLEYLPGVDPGAAQFAGDEEILNAADLVVRVAEANMEIVLAGFVSGTALLVSEGSDVILKRKLLRSGVLATIPDGFARLLELNAIPDIRVAVGSGAVSVGEIWRLRKKRVAKRFRKWLAKGEPATHQELERLYVEILGQTSFVQTLPGRCVRLAITTAVGGSDVLAGVMAGVVDSFFVEKYLAGYRPKLMFDEMRRLFPPQS